MKLAILGTGFISRFYAESLIAQRRKDVVTMIYGRNKDKARKFAEDYKIPNYSTNLKEAIAHKDVDAVVIGLPNDLHLEAVLACAESKKHPLCTKPLGRNAKEALEMLKAVDKAGIVGGYLEDLCYTPKFLKSKWCYRRSDLGQKQGNASGSS